MALETTSDLPAVEQFTLLSDHRQETPTTFFGGKPVLHLRAPAAKIKISSQDLAAQPALQSLRPESASGSSTSSEDVMIDDIDVWVASSFLALVSPAKATCVRILYQTITVHAQEGNAVLLGLNLSDSNTPDEDLVFIQLRILPSNIESYEQPAEDKESHQQPNGDGTTPSNPAQALFKAIADCQELNPDPPEEGEEEYDETAPGTTGWITSENMHEFVDENGEFRIPEGAEVIDGEVEDGVDEGPSSLGQGAGRTRTADEIDATDGTEDESKWQRTG